MTETIIPPVILAAGVGLTALGVAVLRRVRSYRRVPGRVSSQPGAPGMEFSLTRYQPLFRLLSTSDADFLADHRHCPSIRKRWERSQRRVVRLYLKELAADFQALHRTARVMVAQSPDPAHLVPALFQQQMAFWRALIWIEIRLWLHWGGAARINPEALAKAAEALCQELSRA